MLIIFYHQVLAHSRQSVNFYGVEVIKKRLERNVIIEKLFDKNDFVGLVKKKSRVSFY